jgi:hypothetical protein
MICTPTEFELYDNKNLLIKIRMVDEGGASVDLNTVVDEKSWPEISRVIQHALDLMFQEDEV